MKPYQLRIMMEAKELNERLERLLLFLDSEIFIALDGAEQYRMRRQSEIMAEYLNILNQRIKAFQ